MVGRGRGPGAGGGYFDDERDVATMVRFAAANNRSAEQAVLATPFSGPMPCAVGDRAWGGIGGVGSYKLQTV